MKHNIYSYANVFRLLNTDMQNYLQTYHDQERFSDRIDQLSPEEGQSLNGELFNQGFLSYRTNKVLDIPVFFNSMFYNLSDVLDELLGSPVMAGLNYGDIMPAPGIRQDINRCIAQRERGLSQSLSSNQPSTYSCSSNSEMGVSSLLDQASQEASEYALSAEEKNLSAEKKFFSALVPPEQKDLLNLITSEGVVDTKKTRESLPYYDHFKGMDAVMMYREVSSMSDDSKGLQDYLGMMFQAANSLPDQSRDILAAQSYCLYEMMMASLVYDGPSGKPSEDIARSLLGDYDTSPERQYYCVLLAKTKPLLEGFPSNEDLEKKYLTPEESQELCNYIRAKKGKEANKLLLEHRLWDNSSGYVGKELMCYRKGLKLITTESFPIYGHQKKICIENFCALSPQEQDRLALLIGQRGENKAQVTNEGGLTVVNGEQQSPFNAEINCLIEKAYSSRPSVAIRQPDVSPLPFMQRLAPPPIIGQEQANKKPSGGFAPMIRIIEETNQREWLTALREYQNMLKREMQEEKNQQQGTMPFFAAFSRQTWGISKDSKLNAVQKVIKHLEKNTSIATLKLDQQDRAALEQGRLYDIVSRISGYEAAIANAQPGYFKPQ